MKVRMVNLKKRARIEMLPLIDIVFLLLVFFIYAMLSMAVHRGLPVRLPASASAKVEKKLVLSVTVDSNGSVFVDEKPVRLEALRSYLEDQLQTDPDAGVMLFADKIITYQDLFGVLDEIKKAGVTRISLQAEKGGPR